MSSFIQSLESRKMLSANPVTASTLAADQSLVISDVANVNASLGSLGATVVSHTEAIGAAIKGMPPKENSQLFKALVKAEKSDGAVLKKDVKSLIKLATSKSKAATKTGDALLTKPTATNAAKVSAAASALTAAINTEVNSLKSALSANVKPEVSAIIGANPSNTALSADASSFGTDADAAEAAIATAATKTQTDAGTFASDLGAIPT